MTSNSAATPDRRKLVAIVYADMVGYSRLVGLDDQRTLERLRTLRRTLIDPAIDEHGGRIVQTGGDSVLIVFDSIDGAVRCAVKVQQHVPGYDKDQPSDQAIRFRIGINIGDTIADGTDLHGDAVNITARLQTRCPPGGICVSRSVRDHTHGRLGLEFVELGALNLKNIARPIDAYLVRAKPETTLETIDVSLKQGVDADRPSIAALPLTNVELPDKPSIAVLPFVNLSNDPDQQYFADGMVEEITTALSRIRWLFVIARNSSFAYRDHTVDVRQIGRELGVRYVLEGSVRKAGQRVRITAQLIDAANGSHIFADHYEGMLDDLLVLQDQITEEISGIIEPALQRAEIERTRRKPLESLQAYDNYLRALALTDIFTRTSACAMKGYSRNCSGSKFCTRLRFGCSHVHTAQNSGMEQRR